MQQAAGRRQPGDHLRPGESRKAIISYLFEQENKQASEPDIRDHLRTAINLSDGKNIRNRLADLSKDGLIHISERKGGSNIWALQPTEALLTWCYERFPPDEFYKIFTSPCAREFLQTVDLRSDDPSEITPIPDDVPKDLCLLSWDPQDVYQGIVEWRSQALLISPTLWLCIQSVPPEIEIITRLLTRMSYQNRFTVDDEPICNDIFINSFGFICYLGSRVLACLLADLNKYSLAASTISEFLTSIESESALGTLFTEDFLEGVISTFFEYGGD